jgi:hypothetical protein
VYRTGTRDVSKDMASRMSTAKALSLESLVRQLSLDVMDTEATRERVGRYGERGSMDEREGPWMRESGRRSLERKAAWESV